MWWVGLIIFKTLPNLVRNAAGRQRGPFLRSILVYRRPGGIYQYDEAGAGCRRSRESASFPENGGGRRQFPYRNRTQTVVPRRFTMSCHESDEPKIYYYQNLARARSRIFQLDSVCLFQFFTYLKILATNLKINVFSQKSLIGPPQAKIFELLQLPAAISL